jgi:hypothetical protein
MLVARVEPAVEFGVVVSLHVADPIVIQILDSYIG